jgi:hypothetical protein
MKKLIFLQLTKLQKPLKGRSAPGEALSPRESSSNIKCRNFFTFFEDHFRLPELELDLSSQPEFGSAEPVLNPDPKSESETQVDVLKLHNLH